MVVSPARRAGCATSQRRNGRFVVHAADLGLGEGGARAGRAPRRASAGGRSASRSAGRSWCRSRRPRRRRRRRGSTPGGAAARCVPPAAGTFADPRRRAAPRPRGRATAARGRGARRWAIRSCHSHEVEPGHGLGDRMLDLDPPVQLEEEEVAPLDDELGRSGADVADRLGEARPRHRSAARAAPGRGRGRRRLLEHLLVATLHRAVALAEREHGAVGVGEELDLDVARAARGSARGRRGRRRTRLAPRAAQPRPRRRARRVERTTRIPRPPPPAAALTISGGSSRLRDRRHAGLARDPLRRELVAARAQRLRRRPDPGEAGRADRRGEVARSRRGSRSRGGRRRRLPRSRREGAPPGRGTTRSRRPRRRSAHAASRGRRARRPRRSEAELARGAKDAQGDLTAVRDEHLLHGPTLAPGAPTPGVNPGLRADDRLAMATTTLSSQQAAGPR